MTDLTRYDVVLLVEQPLSEADARQVHSLHEDVDVPLAYHVLLPEQDSAAVVEAALGSLYAGEYLAAPPLALPPEELEELRAQGHRQAESDLAATLEHLAAAGAQSHGELVTTDPVEALVAKVAAVDANEVIVLTRPHVVAELFRLDWTSQARRKLGVPVLHLLEHESFDAQAGGGEGVSGF